MREKVLLIVDVQPLEGTKKSKGAPASVAGQTSKLAGVALITGDRTSTSDSNLLAAHKACDAINRPFIHELAMVRVIALFSFF